jgi:hypothetical protein
MTEAHRNDLDLVMQFLFREQQSAGYLSQLVAWLVTKGRLQDTNIYGSQLEYWEMAVYQTILDGYFAVDVPLTSFATTLKKTFKGLEFFQGTPSNWQGRPYAYAYHQQHNGHH